jgi:hypothetical protein
MISDDKLAAIISPTSKLNLKCFFNIIRHSLRITLIIIQFCVFLIHKQLISI